MCEFHTAELDIGFILSDILKERNISNYNTVSLISNNRTNIVKSIQDTFIRNKYVPCFGAYFKFNV